MADWYCASCAYFIPKSPSGGTCRLHTWQRALDILARGACPTPTPVWVRTDEGCLRHRDRSEGLLARLVGGPSDGQRLPYSPRAPLPEWRVRRLTPVRSEEYEELSWESTQQWPDYWTYRLDPTTSERPEPIYRCLETYQRSDDDDDR